MKIAAELLSELNELDEHVSVEAKTSADVGRSLLETICAFSNEPNLGGGCILLGAARADDTFWPSYEVVGVDDPDQIQADIASQCASVFNVPVRPRMVAERLNGKTVIILHVAEVGSHEKPIHFTNEPLPRSAYRRIGSTDQRCTEDDLVIFYQDRRGETYDEQILNDAVVGDFDPDALTLYRQLRREVDPEAEELRWTDQDLLEALGAVKTKDGQSRPTVAGMLLFGTSKALRQYFPMMRIDYIRVPGVRWVRDPDRRFDTVEIRSPLIRAIQRARAAILDDLPRAFSLPAGETQGKEIPLLPDRVIREVIANAVMHRSYRVHGSIQIIRYANRLEIRNPGYSLKAEERLGEPGSETRNPKIAAVFHEIKFAETKGSGIRVMRSLMADRSLSPPVLQSDRTGNNFLAILLFHHFLSQDDLDWLATFAEHNLSDDERKALVSAREVGAIDNSSYRNLNRGTDTLSASRHLKRLCDFDLLLKKGQGTSTYYVPTAKLLTSWDQIQSREVASKPDLSESQSRELASQPGELAPQPGELAPQPGELAPQPGELAPQPGELTLDPWTAPRSAWLTVLPSGLRDEVVALPGKADVDRLGQLVENLCRWKDLPLVALAAIVDRNETYLQTRIVTPMVRSGRIQFSIPDEPNHPKQTYRSAGPIESSGSSLDA